MAIYSPLRSRRLAAQQKEATQRLIIFKLDETTFALELDRVQKVTTLEHTYDDPNGTGVKLTSYQGQELVIIDVAAQIFGNSQPVIPASQSPNRVEYLLMLQPQQGQSVGLVIDSPPNIQSFTLSAFQPLSDLDRQRNDVNCVSAIWIDQSSPESATDDQKSILLLDVNALSTDAELSPKQDY
jgi:chemotaxis signal transduction protein